jgi:hypothetical protein
MSESQVGSDRAPLDSSAGTLEIMSRAARDGAADAREAATRVWSATSLFASRFIYTTCYTVSYGVVFPSMLLAHSIPKNNAAVRGLIDGAQAAIQKVDEVRTASTSTALQVNPVNTAVPALSPG